ncbi:hypothetical protein [Enterobacter ludwigii]|uniref:hypothetical protein n=1 Tax=Enterobacter ludwigii TaxID=299767 RepID=UPI003F701CA0
MSDAQYEAEVAADQASYETVSEEYDEITELLNLAVRNNMVPEEFKVVRNTAFC